MGYVFISYSRTDSTYARALVTHLEAAGIAVWIDKAGIQPGARYRRTTRDAIDLCAAFLVLMTPASEESEWVENEIDRAEKKAKPIYSLLCDGEEFFGLGATQYEDVSDGSMPSERFVAVLAAHASEPRTTDATRDRSNTGTIETGRLSAQESVRDRPAPPQDQVLKWPPPERNVAEAEERRVSANDPQTPTLTFGDLIAEGDEHFEAGELQLALADYEWAIDLEPANVDGHLNKALCLLELGRLDDAVSALDEAIATDPDCAAAYVNRSFALNELGYHDIAVADAEAALQVDPTNAIAYANMGFAQMRLGRNTEALASVDRSIKLEPSASTSHLTQSSILFNLGDLEAALKALNRVIALDPDDPLPYNNRGSILLHLGRPSEALESFNKAVDIDPADPATWTNIADAFSSLGQKREARNARKRSGHASRQRKP